MTPWFRDTILHLRPRSFPIVFTHYLCGALALYPQWKTAPSSIWFHLLLGGVLWTVFLNGGTLAINSAFDRDEGDIGYLDNPPPIPRGLAVLSTLLMGSGLLLAWWLMPRLFTYAYLASFAMSVVYSVPPLRLKAVAGADLAINMVGYGALTFAAGGLAADVHAGVALKVLLLLASSFAFLFAAFYPMTQIYQIPEDRARGDRTLAIMFGARNSLLFAMASILLFGTCQVVAATMVHAGIATAALVMVASLWLGFTTDWIRRLDRYPHQKGMYRALKLWAVADIATVVVFLLASRY